MIELFSFFVSIFSQFFSFIFNFQILPDISIGLFVIYFLILSFLIKSLTKE